MRPSILTNLVKTIKQSEFFDFSLRYHPIYYRRTLSAIQDMGNGSKSERLTSLLPLRDRTLKYAARTGYGKTFGPKFENWPVLQKTQLQTCHRNFVRPHICGVSASTSGSTGTPLKLVRSLENVAAEQAFIDFLLQDYGLTFRNAKIAILRADEIKDPSDKTPPYSTTTHGGKRLVLSNSHLTLQTVDWFVDKLGEFQPQILWVYPSMLANLLYLMDKKGLKLQIPIVLGASELFDSASRQAAAVALKATVIDYYGQAERVCFAYSKNNKEYWFLPSYGYVELTRDNDSADTARVISTSYWNTAMPLVRYDTGDNIIVPTGSTKAELEAIALGLKPFIGIAGRTKDYIETPGGRRIGGLNHIPQNVENTFKVQIIQKSPLHITISVLGNSNFSSLDKEKLRENARKLIPSEIQLDIEKVNQLKTQSNGKTPFVIRFG